MIIIKAYTTFVANYERNKSAIAKQLTTSDYFNFAKMLMNIMILVEYQIPEIKVDLYVCIHTT